jgi:F-type H+-transporting ATPase subunit b
LKFLDNEKKKDEEIKKTHEKAVKQADELAQKEQQLQQTLKIEREKVIEKARNDAEAIRQQILDEAKDQSEKIKQKALKQVAIERDNIYKEAREKINELSFYLVNHALKDVLTDDLRRKVTQQILKNSLKSVNFDEN